MIIAIILRIFAGIVKFADPLESLHVAGLAFAVTGGITADTFGAEGADAFGITPAGLPIGMLLLAEHAITVKSVWTLPVLQAGAAIGSRGQRALAAICGVGVAISPALVANRAASAIGTTGAAMFVDALLVTVAAVIDVGIEIEEFISPSIAIVVIAIAYFRSALIDEIPCVVTICSQTVGAHAIMIVISIEATRTESSQGHTEFIYHSAVGKTAVLGQSAISALPAVNCGAAVKDKAAVRHEAAVPAKAAIFHPAVPLIKP